MPSSRPREPRPRLSRCPAHDAESTSVSCAFRLRGDGDGSVIFRAGAESVMSTVGFDHGARGSGERTRADATNNMLTPSIRWKALPCSGCGLNGSIQQANDGSDCTVRVSLPRAACTAACPSANIPRQSLLSQFSLQPRHRVPSGPSGTAKNHCSRTLGGPRVCSLRRCSRSLLPVFPIIYVLEF